MRRPTALSSAHSDQPTHLGRAVALLAAIFVLALPVAALAHPEGHSPQTSGPPPIQPAPSDGGGTSPVLIAGIVVAGLALAGALYAAKELQKRPPQPAARPAPAAEPKTAGTPVTDHRGVSPEAGA